jgi:formylglycine-generating enzyme required for sulfatase activity
MDTTGMIELPGGGFLMGSVDFYPEEGPVREAAAGPFWIDEAPVTNEEFQDFVAGTGYVTVAERPVTAADYPDADPSLLTPGSLVFRQASGPVDLRDVRNWWSYTPGADWQHPEGPESDLSGRDTHPVVHIACEDAEAYATWAGKELPSEAEWEYAARGGLAGKPYAWGDQLAPGGRLMANIWTGEFPWRRTGSGHDRTSPVKSFPANGYGLYDMIGNVWEWTTDRYTLPASPRARPSCCGGAPPGEAPAGEFRAVKGGSFLCAPNYCRRYRPAARQPQSTDTSASHIGFRCIVREPRSPRSAGSRGRDAGPHPA